MGFVWKIMFLLKISWSHIYGKNPRVFWYLVKELDHFSLSSSMTNTAKPDGLGPYPHPSKSVQSRSPQGPQARTKWLTLSSILPVSTLVSSLSFSMKGIRWPTAFFMTRADFITWGKYTESGIFTRTPGWLLLATCEILAQIILHALSSGQSPWSPLMTAGGVRKEIFVREVNEWGRAEGKQG